MQRNTEETFSIARAAEILGVSVDTIRRWEKETGLKPVRTLAGHRRYTASYCERLRERMTHQHVAVRPQETAETLDASVRAALSEARHYILGLTKRPVLRRDDDPLLNILDDGTLASRIWWTWDVASVDAFVKRALSRVRQHLFVGVKFEELKHLIDQSLDEFIETTIDQRFREEMVAQGIDPDMGGRYT